MRYDELGPEAVIRVSDAATGMRGILVIDNSVNGPAAGGTRMVLDLTETEVADLARAMTYKWAIFGLPTGGAKAGIIGDPRMPADKKRAVLNAFGRAIRPYLSNMDHLLGVGPDMGMSGDEVEYIYEGAGVSNVVTWESPSGWMIDGDPASYHLTGRGVVVAAGVALETLGRRLEGATFAIEGFGQVGAGTARYLEREGARVVAVSTLLGGVHDPQGLDIQRMLELRRLHGDACVLEYGRGERFALERLFSLPVDVLVPGARPGSIDTRNAGDVRALVVCPAGNLAVTADAEEQLHSRGVLCMPDFVANAGGIIACWVDVLGGSGEQALEVVTRLVGAAGVSVLAEARALGRSPVSTARARIRETLLGSTRRPFYSDARAEARRILGIG